MRFRRIPISSKNPFSPSTEVEKQLQGGSGQISLLSGSKSQTGSTGNIHGLVLASEQHSCSSGAQGNTLSRWVSRAFIQRRLLVEPTSSITKLTTFMGGLTSKANSSMVQMRRSTNKKGKQAPAPPKRTR